MAKRTQAQRQMAIATPLGDDVLLFKRMEGTEELGRLFRYEVELVSEEAAIDFDALVGENVTVRVEINEERTRYFNGYVAELTQIDRSDERFHYHATLVPWTWFLTRTSDCRIFQEMSVPAIIEQVFGDHGFPDFEMNLTGTYPDLEYCVQYRESYFDFISRLMEREGIHYWYRHENGKHVMVIADDPTAHQPYEGYEQLSCRLPTKDSADYVWDWEVSKSVRSGSAAITSFDFKAPTKDLKALIARPAPHAAGDFEVFDYPADYVEGSEGSRYAQVRIEELQAEHETTHATSNARGLAVGNLFDLTDNPRADQDRSYLITRAEYVVRSDEFEARPTPGAKAERPFEVSIECIPAAIPYRTPRFHPWPRIRGPQTAIVVGKSGEEIWTDEHGRVKVMFHWDRYAAADENSSCWTRVSQPTAGKGWGAINIPRIGQEVIVEFLEGDPDRPIVTGRVYNGDCKPPYDLPDNRTISGFKSNSSIGGGGFNEMRFEDKKGEEQIFVHAEKNQDNRTKNDSFEWVGHDRHLRIKNDQFEHVENDRNEVIDRDHKEEIGRDHHLKIAGKEAIEVTKEHSFTVTGDVIEVFKKNHSETVTGDYYLKAKNIVIEASANVTIKVGQSFIAIESGGIKIGTTGKIVLDAQQDIEEKAGGNMSLEAGMNMEGKAGLELKLEGGVTAEMKSPMTTVKGDAMCVIKGGAVMIN